MNMYPDHPDFLPDDLRPMDAALADLARHERDAAPASLEPRLASLMPTPTGVAGEHPVLRIQARRFSLAKLRLAAAVALMAGLAAVMMLRSPAPSPAPAGRTPIYAMADLEDDVDLWLSFRTADEFQVISDRIDLIAVDADALSKPIGQDLTTLLEPDAL